MYTNDDQLVESIIPNYTITDKSQRLSDHAMISVKLNVKNVTKRTNNSVMKDNTRTFESFDFYKCTEDTWNSLNDILQKIPWEDKGNPTLNLEHFYDSTLQSCIASGVPMKVLRKGCKNQYYRQRRSIFRKIKRLPKSKDRKIKELQFKLQQTYNDEKQDEEQKAVQCIKKNTKYFYKFVKSHCARKEDVSELKSSQGNLATSDQDKANCLREQYTSVFSAPIDDKDILLKEKFTDTEINDFELDEMNLINAIRELKENTSPGPDKFPSMLLKRIIHSVSNPLLRILQQTVDMNEIPPLLTSSIVCPIYKSGKDRREPSSYRPVSLTSVIMRAFEKVIKKQLVSYFEENNLINDSQHGFRKGRSCLSQLLKHYDDILRKMEEGNQVNVLYIDFEKCFDKVDFKILLNKLKLKGVKGKAYNWLKNFLTKRTFKVRVGKELSEEEDVISGIPQGTCLGPLLMLVMNSDIDARIVNGTVGTLADTKITNTIMTNDDSYKMKNDLKTLEQWTVENNMKMNDDKFVLLCYNKKPNIVNNLPLQNGFVIMEQEGARDLGVWMENDGTFTKHIANVTTSCRKIMSMILRSFTTRDDQILLTLFKSLILSKIDYCSVLWNPIAVNDLRKIEGIQATFTHRMNCAKSDDGQPRNYWQRLKYLKLYSIQRRFERYTVIYVWKIYNGLMHNPGIEFKNKDSRNGLVCKIPKYESKLRWQSFLVNGPKLFNSVPKEVREFPLDELVTQNQAIVNFKKKLDDYLTSIPDEPNRSSKYSSDISGISLCGTRTNSIIRINN